MRSGPESHLVGGWRSLYEHEADRLAPQQWVVTIPGAVDRIHIDRVTTRRRQRQRRRKPMRRTERRKRRSNIGTRPIRRHIHRRNTIHIHRHRDRRHRIRIDRPTRNNHIIARGLRRNIHRTKRRRGRISTRRRSGQPADRPDRGQGCPQQRERAFGFEPLCPISSHRKYPFMPSWRINLISESTIETQRESWIGVRGDGAYKTRTICRYSVGKRQ